MDLWIILLYGLESIIIFIYFDAQIVSDSTVGSINTSRRLLAKDPYLYAVHNNTGEARTSKREGLLAICKKKFSLFLTFMHDAFYFHPTFVFSRALSHLQSHFSHTATWDWKSKHSLCCLQVFIATFTGKKLKSRAWMLYSRSHRSFRSEQELGLLEPESEEVFQMW